MTNEVLISPHDAVPHIASLFSANVACSVAVCEEDAFGKPQYVPLGDIRLFPPRWEPDAIEAAVRLGSFGWTTPELAAATTVLTQALGISELQGETRGKAEDKLRRVLDSMGAIAVRLGLSHPIFDPRAFEAMPFRRPTTVLSDTSGVIQGGLSFVSRFLHPAARIKVPAVVQMEIVNFAERFLSNRRAQRVRAIDLLGDHLKSQGGQRVLLQLELNSDVELERTYLLGDPLRATFQREEDKELKELNLSVAIRAYADRLILEAARQHQSQVSYGHPVMLLTSDQGLARMAIAEGLSPLYFHSVKADALFGKTFTGTNFNPFNGALCTTSIVDVLWELATVFGCARLQNPGGSSLLIHAIGRDLAWAPYHSHDDLLWVSTVTGGVASLAAAGQPPLAPAIDDVTAPAQAISAPMRKKPAKKKPTEESSRSDPALKKGLSLYKFSVDRMIDLIDLLDSEQRLLESDVFEVLSVKASSAVNDYRRYLESGEAIVIDESAWHARAPLTRVAIALRNLDISELRNALGAFPSYAALVQLLRERAVGEPLPPDSLGRAISTYQTLAEITELGVNVLDAGFFATPTIPSDEEFARVALHHFERLEQGNGWVATGRWLEELIISEGIHPLVARAKLQSASERRLLKRVTEGSTTETKFDRHVLRVLALRGRFPAVEVIHLYRGDFLIPGKSSSSLRIEGVQQ